LIQPVTKFAEPPPRFLNFIVSHQRRGPAPEFFLLLLRFCGISFLVGGIAGGNCDNEKQRN
ncbi:MAG: hypothetical protein ACRD9Y_07305, partial [Blastocatellia bacterium]